MQKQDYLKLRGELNLKPHRGALLRYFLTDTVLVCAVFALEFSAVPGIRYLSIPIIATLMFRNFSIMHEAVHGIASKNKLVNDFCGLISGALSLLPFDAWRRSHLEHHYWAGNVDKDPVMALVKVLPAMPEKTRRRLNLGWKYWIPLMAVMQHWVFWNLSAKQFLQNPKRPFLLASLALPVLFWSAVFSVLPMSFTMPIVVPALVLYLISVEVVNFPHHLRLPQHHNDERLHIWEQHEIARSCIYPRWLSRLVVLNFNYHAEHHMFPDAPWYHLDKIHDRLQTLIGDELNTDEKMAFIVNNRKKPLEDLMAPGQARPAKKAS